MSDTAVADLAYSNGAFIPGAAEYPARWEAKAAAFRDSLGTRAVCDVPYGPRVAYDLFLPEGTPKGVLVFVHGGYWLAFGRRDWSHLAAGASARGWACAMPAYTLAPAARISQMTREIATAIKAIADRVPGPMVVTGHSAGGHLAARMGCVEGPVSRVVPISPLADLGPIMGTAMNKKLRLDAAEVTAESPAFLPLRADVQAHVWVGGQERPSFLWQARTLSENWNCPWTVALGKHHFDVIDDLENPDSALMETCLGGF
jgi:arylformamidase